MSIEDSILRKENALVSKLQEKQTAIDDRTGKGLATEAVIEQELLKPFLPPGFDCGKGAVVTAERPDQQSAAIDRVIFDKAAAPPLVHDESHSIFPIEIVCGLVEITMRLDATKLRTDIERMAPVKAMTTRRYLEPAPNTRTRVLEVERRALSPRSFVIGLPSDPNWDINTIAKNLRQIQIELGPPTHIHGLYVLGVGFFYTVPIENEREPMYRVVGWTGPDRLFRFVDNFRQAFDRWERLAPGCSVNWGSYVSGKPAVLAE